jgi:hypothetical protein
MDIRARVEGEEDEDFRKAMNNSLADNCRYRYQ